MQESITGRDEMLKGHAMVIALPFYLLNSVEPSIAFDLMRIMEKTPRFMPMGRGYFQEQVFEMLRKLAAGQTSPQNFSHETGKDGMMEMLIKQYFENLEHYLPDGWVSDWIEGEANDHEEKSESRKDDQMDESLESYLEKLREKHPDKKFPNFCSVYSNSLKNKNILAVLQDPGNSGAEDTNECSIENEDPTAERQKCVLTEVGISPDKVLFWNFFPFFDFKNTKIEDKDRICWANHLRCLCDLLPNLRVIIFCGNVAQRGKGHFKPPVGVEMIDTPHPSNMGMIKKGKSKQLKEGWKQAKKTARMTVDANSGPTVG